MELTPTSALQEQKYFSFQYVKIWALAQLQKDCIHIPVYAASHATSTGLSL